MACYKMLTKYKTWRQLGLHRCAYVKNVVLIVLIYQIFYLNSSIVVMLPEILVCDAEFLLILLI